MQTYCRLESSVVNALIQPSFGNAAAQAHWKRTLDEEVDFIEAGRQGLLTDDQVTILSRLHPSGRANFWGSVAKHDAMMADLTTGDIVIFTGQKMALAIGEVGHSFVNAEFADSMWTPHPTNGPFHNVYSLLSFASARIPYEELWPLTDSNAGDNYMGQRMLRGDRAEKLLNGLGIITETRQLQLDRQAAHTAANTPDTTASTLLAPEAVNTLSATYTMLQRQVVINRIEATFVQAYLNNLPAGATHKRISCSAGVTDIYVTGPGHNADLVEAKSRSDHDLVRQALGQLLDYKHAIELPITTLTALFPTKPSSADLALLSHYGIDCVFAESDDTFTRIEAPEAARNTWTAPAEPL